STIPTNNATNSTTPGPVIYPYNTVLVPPNNGTWQICSQENTNYVSYSLRVVDDSSPITPNYGTTNDSQLSPNPTAPTVGVVARIIYSNGLEFVPSLSCYNEIIKECDQDTGKILMEDKDKYCLQIINPGQLSQKVNVTVSFTSTVFKDGGFTSANRPGGNAKPLNNSNSSDSSASINCGSTLGICMISMMSWLVFCVFQSSI
ncbi:15884_t:CDS:2, partial [Acaulospora colombiana]